MGKALLEDIALAQAAMEAHSSSSVAQERSQPADHLGWNFLVLYAKEDFLPPNSVYIYRVLDAEKQSCVNNLNNLKQKITHSYLEDQWIHVYYVHQF